MISRITGAFVRMVLVMLLVALPSLLVATNPHGQQAVALVAIFAGGLTFAEYASRVPSLIEFRAAPPFNRLRFALLFLTLLALSLMIRGHHSPTPLSDLVLRSGDLLGRSIDLPFSPVRLVLAILPESLGPEQRDLVRAAAGLSYLISLLMLAVFAFCLRVGHWPGRGTSFNVWVNLPTFDPTAGRDVVFRLERDAKINVILGFFLPFLIPLFAGLLLGQMTPEQLNNAALLVWGVAAWSFLPASLFMRGIAMHRIATMIRTQRRLAAPSPASAGLAPASS